MNAKSIGRRVTFKYSLIGAVVIFLILILTGFYFFFFEDIPLRFGFSLKEVAENLYFLIVQVIVVLLAIRYWGARAGKLIIEHGSSKIWVSTRTIVLIWISLAVSCGIAAGIENSIEYGWKGFYGAFLMWMAYGFIPFLLLGGAHAILFSYWMGNEINRKGKTHYKKV